MLALTLVTAPALLLSTLTTSAATTACLPLPPCRPGSPGGAAELVVGPARNALVRVARVAATQNRLAAVTMSAIPLQTVPTVVRKWRRGGAASPPIPLISSLLRGRRVVCSTYRYRPVGPGRRVRRRARRWIGSGRPGWSYRDRNPRGRCPRPGCSGAPQRYRLRCSRRCCCRSW